MNDSLPWRRPGFPAPGDLMRVGRALVVDPDYARLWRATHQWDVLDDAGFLVDGLSCYDRPAFLGPASPHVAWLSTPLPVGMPETDQEVVLVSTGSFAPLHEGHVAMFDLAEKALLDRGIRVLASYLSPSHDVYVSTKPGADQYPASRRIHEARRTFEKTSINGVDRLVDPWESLFVPVSLNFTTVIARMQAYLARHLGRTVRVVYLFGADNAAFADALYSPDDIPAGICIGRPGQAPRSTPSTWYLPATNDHASSRLRSTANFKPASGDAITPAPYLVRDDGSFALQHWLDLMPAAPLLAAWNEFVASLLPILANAFVGQTPSPSGMVAVSLEAQHQSLLQIANTAQVASMDVCTQSHPGVVPISITRYFRAAHGQCHPMHRGPRPGDDLAIAPCDLAILQSANLPVSLVDDDIATGRSMDAVEHHLQSQGVQITSRASLSPSMSFDIVDARDFLPGAFMAGLTVQLPFGHRGRLPYMAPFVDLSTRALLPAESCISSSIAIWRASANFFLSLPLVLCVSDMHPDQRTLFQTQGFTLDQPLSEVCFVLAQWLESGAPAR